MDFTLQEGGNGSMVPFSPMPTYAFTLFSVNAERGDNFLKIGEKIGGVDLHSVLKLGSVDLYSVPVFCNFAHFAKLNRDRQ